jgi:hypothetical protein
MSRIAVVGCEASGKTVFMAAITDHYRRPDAACGCVLVPENSTANKFAAYLHRSMRQLRQWPAATNPDETRRMAWTLRRGGETLAEIEMLEFGGETFREAFRDDSPPETRRKAVAELQDYLKNADFVVVLVSLAHVFQDPSAVGAEDFGRAVEAEWATRNLLKFVAHEMPSGTGIVIGLTQADRFADRLAAAGGPADALSEYWPGVRAAAPDVPVLPVASVSATDSAGLPLEGYNTDGIMPVMREFSRHVFGDAAALEAGAIQAKNSPEEREPVRPVPEAAPVRADAKSSESAKTHGTVKAVLAVFFAVVAAYAVHRALRTRFPSAAKPPACTNVVSAVTVRATSAMNGIPAVVSSPADATNNPPAAAPSSVSTTGGLAAVVSPAVTSIVAKTSSSSPTGGLAVAASPSTNATDKLPAAVPHDVSSSFASLVSALDSEDAERARRLVEEIGRSDGLSDEQKGRLSAAKKLCSLLERAFDGDVAAQTSLAEAYYGGKVFARKNLPRAHLWYTIAANSGGVKAQLALAVMYEEGQGVRPDAAEARFWYRKAAEGGEADAMYRVGVDSYSTNATPQQKSEANTWFRRAKKAGSKIPNLDAWIKLTE